MNTCRLALNRFSYFALVAILIFLTGVIVPYGNIKRYNPIVLATFLINGFVWTILLVKELKRVPYSFAMIHWCFNLLFFFFAALEQYMNNSFPWVEYRSDEVVTVANLLLLIWTAGILIGQYGNIKGFRTSLFSLDKNIEIMNNFIFVLVAFLVMMWRVKNVGLLNLMARSTSGQYISDNGSISMLVETSVQAVAYFSTALVVLKNKKRRTKLPIIIICLTCLVISYPPSGIARFAAAAIYLGLMLTWFDMFKKTNLFVFVLLGAFSIAMPLLNAFRSVAFADVNLEQLLNSIVNNFSRMWLSGDYDAYTMFTLAIDHVQVHGMTWFYQLLGVILFWVPRAIWKNKPVGSGHYIAEKLGWSFKNLACPLPAEAYMNFGIIGIVVFSIALGRIMKKIDALYWKKTGDENVRRIDTLYPVLIVLFFFMCRGDLMSSIAYMSAYFIVGLLLSKKKNRYSAIDG